MKVNPIPIDGEPCEPDANVVENDHIISRLMFLIQKQISAIAGNQVIDVIAIWTYLALFFVFNCFYWGYYLNRSAF